jgi:hypothetical protein
MKHKTAPRYSLREAVPFNAAQQGRRRRTLPALVGCIFSEIRRCCSDACRCWISQRFALPSSSCCLVLARDFRLVVPFRSPRQHFFPVHLISQRPA